MPCSSWNCPVIFLFVAPFSLHTRLLEKYLTIFIFRKRAGFQWIALAWGDIEFSYACVHFFPPVNCFSWWKAAFEWGNVQYSRPIFIVRKMTIWFPGRTRTHRTCWTPQLHKHHNPWWRVLGVRVRPGTRNFPYNENPTRALNSTSLKYCLPSTDAIDMREKFTHAYEGSRSPHASTLYWNPPGFRKRKIRSDNFLTVVF